MTINGQLKLIFKIVKVGVDIVLELLKLFT